MSSIIEGVIPVVPTIFGENEELDLDGQRRVAQYLLHGGVDGMCLLANYSEQFSLTDLERCEVIDATVEEVAGATPIMVTTSHYSSKIAAERSLDAQRRGATIVMLMPPFFGATMGVNDDGVVEYFKRVADAISIDIMVQDAPLSTTPLSVALIARLAVEIPQLKYAKIEVPRSAQKIRTLIDLAGDELPGVFDGEESITLIPDLHAGVRGTMCSVVIPDRLGKIVHEFHAGRVDQATADWEALLPLIHYENRQCGLVAAKELLAAGEIIASPRSRKPLAEVPEWARTALIELALRQDALILRWGKE